MTSLTLKNIPALMLERLRTDAGLERRSLNQHALYLLEQALGQRKPTFGEALRRFRERAGALEDSHDAFEGLRDRSPGRDGEP